jgi:hypothetical protein
MVAHTKQGNKQFKWAFILSSTSMLFGILREFLIVFLFGFTAKNDSLQLYLSIFYTIGLSVDAMRLACLNLFLLLPLSKLLVVASFIAFPFSLIIAILLSYSTGGLNPTLLGITIIGSYLSLMAVLLITYKQRNNVFLLAQVIHIIPNFILIPGIIFCYIYFPTHLIVFIICMTSFIPLLQFLLLLFLPIKSQPIHLKKEITIRAALGILIRHFSAGLGEQGFQIISRAAFYTYATGYLSMYAFAIRVYAAARFILIDSFIVSRLSNWQHEKNFIDDCLSFLINLTFFSAFTAMILLLISMLSSSNNIVALFQVFSILVFGFYFSTLARVCYFKINHYASHSSLVIRFAMIEFLATLFAYLITKKPHYSIFVLLWIGFIAKPFFQLIMLRKKYDSLTLESRGSTSEIYS